MKTAAVLFMQALSHHISCHFPSRYSGFILPSSISPVFITKQLSVTKLYFAGRLLDSRFPSVFAIILKGFP